MQKGAFESNPKSTTMPKGCEQTPLMWIFEIKKENKRRKSRIVVGIHVDDASTLPTYYYFAQNLSIFLPLLITKASKINVATGDVEYARINANAGETVASCAGSEQDDKKGCALEIIKALNVSKTLARYQSLCLGKTLCRMGFNRQKLTPTYG